MENYDITDYLKDDKELQKAVIEELLKELSTQQGKLDAYQMSENEANEIIVELKQKVKDLQVRKDKYYLQTLNDEIQLSDYITCLQEIKTIAETAINGGYATKSSDYSEGMEIIGHYVLQKITKAEEE